MAGCHLLRCIRNAVLELCAIPMLRDYYAVHSTAGLSLPCSRSRRQRKLLDGRLPVARLGELPL